MSHVNSKDENAEPNTGRTCPSPNSDNVHDEDSTPESCLETIHGKESPRLQGVAEEEDNREDIDQEYNGDEQHEYDNGPALC
jgi:hypothetical protein